MKQHEYTVISSIEQLLPAEYVFVTDMSSGLSFPSAKIAAWLGLSEKEYSDFFTLLSNYTHPFDKAEYLEGIENRLQHRDLDVDLCIRFVYGTDYHVFNLYMNFIPDESGKSEYLVTIIHDNSLGPNLDYRTGLFAAPRFERDIQFVVHNESRTSVILVTLDHLESINMLYGKDCSHALFNDIAVQFIYMMDADKAVYRVNDAGFTFVLRNTGRDEAAVFAEKIKNCLENDITFQGKRLPLRHSMGAILLENFDGNPNTIQSMLEYTVDVARFRRQHYLLFFNDLVTINNNTGFEIIRDIHRSVQSGCQGFFVEYQPIVSSRDGKITGAEALVRWRSDNYGLIPPGMFISWMEDNACMYDVGNFVLKTALTDSKKFLEIDPDFFININISEKQLERPEFRDFVMNTLEELDFPSRNLCLELTERCKNMPLDMLSREVAFFRKQGIRIALDDYGTGSASSNVVLNVPVDEIKVDMSFIRGITNNPKQQFMVKGIIDFANSTGLLSCIEGVETEELQDYLRAFGSTWFQGYFYSRPISAENLLKCILGTG